MTSSERISFLLGVLAFLLSAGWVSWSARLEVVEPGVCEAAAEGRWQQILRDTQGPLSNDAAGRDAAECRCWALLATGERDECIESMARLLGDPAIGAWLPDPLLAGLGIRRLRDLGEAERAAELAARGAERHSGDVTLLELSLSTRADLEGEEAVLADAMARLEREPEPALRLAVASLQRRRGDHEAALAALGDRPPEGRARAEAWFEAVTASQAALGDLAAVRRSFADWRAVEENEAGLRARYALRLSLSQLPDPERGVRNLLRASLAERDAIADAEIVRLVTQRAIAHALAEGDVDEALAIFESAEPAHAPRGITRQQIERQRDDGATEAGTLRFTAPAELAGGSIALSPGAAAASDADYETRVLTAGTAEFGRSRGPWPERWIARDASGRVRASGRVWPRPGAVREVAIELAPPASASRHEVGPPAGERAGPDGRRRVLAVVLDCADWRLTEYLRQRGELPVFEHLREIGWRAVLRSDPPLTAAAMEKLVWPERGRPVTVLSWVHQLGLELAGLEAVGRNPMAFLEPALPRGANLFEVIGSGPHRAANMLFSHGMIDGGTHAQIVGPRSQRQPARRSRASRALAPVEQRRYPALLRDPRARPQVESVAADFDAAVEVARAKEVDFLFLRIEALDLLTHAYFAALVENAQDDGDAILLEVYRYIDARLGQVWNALDRDDVLVVLSDHGIRTSMQHAEDAIFVAAGGGLPHGRTAGMPDLAGVPRLLTDYLGVETSWPDHGIAPVPAALARAEAE